MLGDAADWSAPRLRSPTDTCAALAPLVSTLRIDQLINEFTDRTGWVHTSTRTPERAVNQIMTITGCGTHAVISRG